MYFDELIKIFGQDCEPFDIICNLAFGKKIRTRKEKVKNVLEQKFLDTFSKKCRLVLKSILDKYAEQGIEQVETTDILKLKPFSELGTPLEIIDLFGGVEEYLLTIKNLTKEIYSL